MIPSRALDYAPLLRGSSLRGRVRAATSNNLMVIAGTVGGLLLLVPVVVVAALVATDNAHDVGGLVVLGGCFAIGVYVMVDILGQSGGADAFAGFAHANGLVLVQGVTEPDYAGRQFADGTHMVHQAVRTRDAAFVEVGDRFPVTDPRQGPPSAKKLYLRARLAGLAARDPYDAGVVGPELHQALYELAGPYRVEASGDELTLFGEEALRPERRGRVQRAFALLDELVAVVNAGCVPHASATAAPTAPVEQARTGRHPLVVVAWTLGALVVLPLGFAIAMSVLDDHLPRNAFVGTIVAVLVVAGACALVGRLVRVAVSPKGSGARVGRHERD